MLFKMISSINIGFVIKVNETSLALHLDVRPISDSSVENRHQNYSTDRLFINSHKVIHKPVINNEVAQSSRRQFFLNIDTCT